MGDAAQGDVPSGDATGTGTGTAVTAALRRLLERRLFAEAEEGTFALEVLAGRLPTGLKGRLMMNGPGRLAGGRAQPWRDTHWLDGDGLLTVIELDGSPDAGDASAPGSICQRLVQTQKLEEERAARRRVFRRFGTAFPEDRLERGVGLVSPANVSVARIGAHYVACGEQGIPLQFDPATLTTLGPFRAGGALTPITPFAAHLRADPRSGETFAFGVSFAARRPQLNLYRFDAGGSLVARSRCDLPYAASVHDFALSPRFAHFFVAPYCLDMSRLRQGSSVLEALEWQPDLGSEWLIVDRNSGELTARIAVGNGYCLHLANAFEQGDRVVVDLIEYEAPLYPSYRLPDLYHRVPRGVPTRLSWNPSAPNAPVERIAIATSGGAPDFPAVQPSRELRSTQASWLVDLPRRDGPSFFDRLVRVDWDEAATSEHIPGSGYLFAGEPAVAEVEGEPWVLAVVHFAPELAALQAPGQAPGRQKPGADACEPETQLWVYRGFALERGPQARLALPNVPPRFHCLFEANTARSPANR